MTTDSMAYILGRVISTKCMPCELHGVRILGDQDTMNGLLEECAALFRRGVFFVLDGADGVQGGVGIVTAEGTSEGIDAGLQGDDLRLQAADVLQDGDRGVGSVFPDKGGQAGQLLPAVTDPGLEGRRLRDALLVCGVRDGINQGTGGPDHILVRRHGVQDLHDGSLQGLQAGRADTVPAAGIIPLHLAGAGLSAVIQGHQRPAGGAMDEPGERIDRAGPVFRRGFPVPLADPRHPRPLLRAQDRRHAARHADGLRGRDP